MERFIKIVTNIVISVGFLGVGIGFLGYLLKHPDFKGPSLPEVMKSPNQAVKVNPLDVVKKIVTPKLPEITNAGLLDDDEVTAKAAAKAAAELEKTKPHVVYSEGVVDPSAIDRIEELNVSGEVKQEILDNYYRTGVLPSILGPEKPVANREPASNQ